MKWIYGKSGGVSRLFNPQYITAVDFNNKMFFTRDTSGGWTFEEDDMNLLMRLTSRTPEIKKEEKNHGHNKS